MTKKDNKGIRLVALQGSVRPGNYTAKALAIVADEVDKTEGVMLEIIDPTNLGLLMPGMSGDTSGAELVQKKVGEATGVILATPEYHGTFSSVIKLVLENMGFPSKLSGKPVALLGVAAGEIGAIKALEHLRSVASHVGGIVLPGPVSVPRVNQVFDEAGNCLDDKIEKRIRKVPIHLVDYIRENLCPRIALEEMLRLDQA